MTVPLAIEATSVTPRARTSNYPEPYYRRMSRRMKRQLGDAFGLRSFGVNLTVLQPGGESALLHRHSVQDEFVYILQGEPTLVTDRGEVALRPGMCCGFAANGAAHQIVNRTSSDVVMLEVGDRQPGDTASYPADDIAAAQDGDGNWVFARKDGTPY